jgi:putative PEP-CTERM system integral membrane protein
MPDETPSPEIPRRRLAGLRGLLPHFVFWSWNAIFLTVASFGITPLFGLALLAEALEDFATFSILAAAALVVLVPLSATMLGALVLRRDPRRLLGLFYAVEAPLFVLALGRLFLVRDLTPAVAYVLVATIVGVGAYLYRLLSGVEETRVPRVLLGLAGDTVGLGIALYTGALLAFFAVPVGWVVLAAFFRFEWLHGVFHALFENPFLSLLFLFGAVLFVFSATLFALLPPMLITLYARRFAAGWASASGRVGSARAGLVAGSVMTALVAGFLAAARQPQQAALAALAEPPANDAARSAQLAGAERLRDGLTNAYLAPWRYLGATGDASAVRELWERELHLGHDAALSVQAAFNAVARPFLYEGADGAAARGVAADRYAAFFDRSIQRGEKPRVLAALEATYSREDREAGLLTEGGRKVHVATQEVRVVDEHGDWAELELHEVYENRTTDPQEVLYYFSLPETAAVTGLWLGDTDDRGAAFAFTISPRGAAQRVYRAEVARRRDPALLEQVGPRQYRLRAFPIPARTGTLDRDRPWRPRVQEGRPMHLWLRYRALAEGGAWPLPRLGEERNAYRDRATRRSIDGSPLTLASEVWLPPSVPAHAGVTPGEHRVRLDDATVLVATPEAAPTAAPSGLRLAVVLDRSYSMRAQAGRVVTAMDWIRARVATKNDVELYLTSAPSRGEPPTRLSELRGFDARGVVYYGGQDPAELVDQLEALRGDTRYDGVVVLTDEGGFDLAGAKRQPRDLGAPLWMVHLGGDLAPGYDDATLETIQKRGGGVTTSVEEAFARLAARATDPGDLGWADGYRWRLAGEGGEAKADGFAAIAARHAIPGLARAAGVEGLDAIHRLARAHGVVTPYSSMIVLVDEAQRQALREAEARADRFERAVETGEAQLTAPPSPLGGDLTGTPEPEEWILLALSAAALGWVARRRPPGVRGPDRSPCRA